jgi:hypothetical protein
MNDAPDFRTPGADGELAPGTSLWRKGLVYTTRTAKPADWHSRDGYRISVGFKRGGAAVNSATGFHDAYRRVATIANYRVSQLTCPATGEAPNSLILGHMWGALAENIIAALITLSMRCSHLNGRGERGEPPPSAESLSAPGGATLEELERLAPQRADEIYNEFDFTDPAMPDSAPISLSYGERIPGGDAAVDFGPFVRRAETVARSYHTLLRNFNEAGAQPFRIRRREWFLASESLVTIHICFER